MIFVFGVTHFVGIVLFYYLEFQGCSFFKFMGAEVSFVDVDIFVDAVSSVTFVDSVSNMKYVVYDSYLKSLFCQSTASTSHKTNGKNTKRPRKS